MNYCHVNYSKRGQIKIQQMAFVLVAIMIFLSFGAMFYFSLSVSKLKGDDEDLREKEVKETVRRLAGSPEFSWTVYDCPNCIDLDKVMVLKDLESYNGFWKRIPLLKVERVYPRYGNGECTRDKYPECDKITIIETGENVIAYSSFVSLCRYDNLIDSERCELGKLIMGFETIQ